MNANEIFKWCEVCQDETSHYRAGRGNITICCRNRKAHIEANKIRDNSEKLLISSPSRIRTSLDKLNQIRQSAYYKGESFPFTM